MPEPLDSAAKDVRRMRNSRGHLHNAPVLSVKNVSSKEEVTMALLQSNGRLTFLRAHDVGSGWGPQTDFLDVEVVFKLDTALDLAFGFQLRNDANQAAHQAMLDLLRDAFSHGWRVSTDYDIATGRKNGRAIRVALLK